MAVIGGGEGHGDGDGGGGNFHHRGDPRGDGYWVKFSSKNFFGFKKFNFFRKEYFPIKFYSSQFNFMF